jgi:hypothetical protein
MKQTKTFKESFSINKERRDNYWLSFTEKS